MSILPAASTATAACYLGICNAQVVYAFRARQKFLTPPTELDQSIYAKRLDEVNTTDAAFFGFVHKKALFFMVEPLIAVYIGGGFLADTDWLLRTLFLICAVAIILLFVKTYRLYEHVIAARHRFTDRGLSKRKRVSRLRPVGLETAPVRKSRVDQDNPSSSTIAAYDVTHALKRFLVCTAIAVPVVVIAVRHHAAGISLVLLIALVAIAVAVALRHSVLAIAAIELKRISRMQREKEEHAQSLAKVRNESNTFLWIWGLLLSPLMLLAFVVSIGSMAAMTLFALLELLNIRPSWFNESMGGGADYSSPTTSGSSSPGISAGDFDPAPIVDTLMEHASLYSWLAPYGSLILSLLTVGSIGLAITALKEVSLVRARVQVAQSAALSRPRLRPKKCRKNRA